VHQQRLSPSARNVDLKAPSDAIIGSACAYPATRPDKISRPEVERRKGVYALGPLSAERHVSPHTIATPLRVPEQIVFA
jgi:hypothetical protein